MKFAFLSIAAFFLSNLALAPTLAQQPQRAPAPTLATPRLTWQYPIACSATLKSFSDNKN